MCGRYNLRVSPAELQEFFDLLRPPPEFRARYNIAPTQTVLAIRTADHEREAALLRWGLVPGWAKDTQFAAKMINARAETVAEKPAFKASFRRRRCLIPASGFYEWKRVGTAKQPYHIHSRSDALLAFAGLWDRWEKGPAPLESCTIITTAANPLMAQLHDRMPVILPREHWAPWLDPDVDPAHLTDLLQPYAGQDLLAEPVSTKVNNARNETPECLTPVEPPAGV